MLNHHLAGLLGLGSLAWAGHQIHIALPINKLLDAGIDPKEIPLPHDFLLKSQLMADLYPSFAKGVAPFFTLNWVEYADFLTFKGGLNPVTGGLWLSDTAHHHLAIAVLFIVAGHMYRTNWGIGHSMKEILEAHRGPFTGEGHTGLYEILTTSWHAQLAINLAMLGSLSIIVAHHMYAMPPYPYLATDYGTQLSLFTHHMWIGGFCVVGAGAHAAIFMVRDYDPTNNYNNLLDRVIRHRDAIISHLNWVSIFLGFHSFGLYIHNDTMSALGRPQDMFSDTAIQLQPVFAQWIQKTHFLAPQFTAPNALAATSVSWGGDLVAVGGKVAMMPISLGTADFMVQNVVDHVKLRYMLESFVSMLDFKIKLYFSPFRNFLCVRCANFHQKLGIHRFQDQQLFRGFDSKVKTESQLQTKLAFTRLSTSLNLTIQKLSLLVLKLGKENLRFYIKSFESRVVNLRLTPLDSKKIVLTWFRVRARRTQTSLNLWIFTHSCLESIDSYPAFDFLSTLNLPGFKGKPKVNLLPWIQSKQSYNDSKLKRSTKLRFQLLHSKLNKDNNPFYTLTYQPWLRSFKPLRSQPDKEFLTLNKELLVNFCLFEQEKLAKRENLKVRTNQQETDSVSGSSETTREASFDFSEYYKNLPSHLTPQHCSINFLCWFIGFFEADGYLSNQKENLETIHSAFIVNKKTIGFEINQKDPQLMHKIRTILGFGVVYEIKKSDGSIYSRYYTNKKENLLRLIYLFNGNLILTKKRIQFESFLLMVQKLWGIQIVLKEWTAKISLNNAWLSGFIEGDGGFYTNQSRFFQRGKDINEKIRFGFYLKFYLTQKGEEKTLLCIRNLFQAKNKLSTFKKKTNGTTYLRLEISNSKSRELIINYLTQFTLRGQKNIQLKQWIRLHGYQLRGEKLTFESAKKFYTLFKQLDENKLTDSFWKKLNACTEDINNIDEKKLNDAIFVEMNSKSSSEK